jgi:hypothetical protein
LQTLLRGRTRKKFPRDEASTFQREEQLMKRSLITLAVAALIPLGAAVAGDKAGKAPSFDSLDVNSDGRISQTEAAVDSKLVFSSADVNGDGYLDKAEWKASMKGSATPAPAPQSAPVSPTDPGMPQTSDQSSDPASTPQSDTETPR